MKLIELRITAFGPFCKEEVIAFTPFSRHIFLIKGDTGAGKTTILDAIVFALYGDTSGGARDAGYMRNLSAGADLDTTVTLTFEIAEERWRITRTPHHMREKKRGTGQTEVNSTVELENLTAKTAVPKKEIDKKIASLIGFDKAQFRMVMVLPQGQFRQFLECGTKEKAELLSKIFEDATLYKNLTDNLIKKHNEAKTLYANELEVLLNERKHATSILGITEVPDCAVALQRMFEQKEEAFQALKNELEEVKAAYEAKRKALEVAKEVNEKIENSLRSAAALSQWQTTNGETLKSLEKALNRHQQSLPFCFAHEAWEKEKEQHEKDLAALEKVRGENDKATNTLAVVQANAPTDLEREEYFRLSHRAQDLIARKDRISVNRCKECECKGSILQARQGLETLVPQMKKLKEKEEAFSILAKTEPELARKVHAEDATLQRLNEAITSATTLEDRKKDIEMAEGILRNAFKNKHDLEEAEASAMRQLQEAEPRLKKQIEDTKKRLGICDSILSLDDQCKKNAEEKAKLTANLEDAKQVLEKAKVSLDKAISAKENAAKLIEEQNKAMQRTKVLEKILKSKEALETLGKEYRVLEADAKAKKLLADEVENEWLDYAAVQMAKRMSDGMPCPVCGNVHYVKLADAEETSRATEAEAQKAKKAYEDVRLQAVGKFSVLEQGKKDFQTMLVEAEIEDAGAISVLLEREKKKTVDIVKAIEELKAPTPEVLKKINDEFVRAQNAWNNADKALGAANAVALTHENERKAKVEELEIPTDTNYVALQARLVNDSAILEEGLKGFINAWEESKNKKARAEADESSAKTKRDEALRYSAEAENELKERLCQADLSLDVSLQQLQELKECSDKRLEELRQAAKKASDAAKELENVQKTLQEMDTQKKNHGAAMTKAEGQLLQIEDSLKTDLEAFDENQRTEEAIAKVCAETQTAAENLDKSIKAREKALQTAKEDAAAKRAAFKSAEKTEKESDEAFKVADAKLKEEASKFAFPSEEILGWNLRERFEDTAKDAEKLKRAHSQLEALAQSAAAEAKDLVKVDVMPLEAQAKDLQEKTLEKERQFGVEENSLEKGRAAVKECFEKEEKSKDAFDKVETLKKLSETMSGRNNQEMSLERFVLSGLFDEVLEAGNRRLAALSQDRYSMRRPNPNNPHLGRKEDESLSIYVYDSHYGKTRPASTLSGGEGFLASLSLALGLSDIIGSRQGGASLETFFIDEGFGTLDSNSCREVSKVLAQLSESGRTVGIISHVQELAEAIPMSLTVRRTEGNSHCVVDLGD